MSQYALITGAAKGIGRAIAENLASRNYDLLLTDRDEENLLITAEYIRQKYQKEVRLLVMDLTDKESAYQLWHWSFTYHDRLTVVVNNAGYGLNAPFTALPLRDHIDLINVNIHALIGISYLFAPVLQQKEKAWLLNVGSTTAYQSIPYLNTYASSKAFVLSFTRGLRYELKNTSVSVSCLSPGSTDTHFVHRAGMSDSTKKTAARYNMTPQKVATIAINGLFRGKAEIIPGISNKLHAWLVKLFPKTFIEHTGAKIYGSGHVKNKWSPSVRLLEEEDFLPAFNS